MNKRYETYESRLESGGLSDDFAGVDSDLDALRRQIESLRLVAIGCLLLSAVVLAYLIYQSLLTTKDLAVLTQDGGVIAGKLDGISARVSNIEGLTVNLVTRMQSPAPAPAAQAAPPGLEGWTGINLSDLTPLLPYLAVPGAGTGELWLYSNNDPFVDRVAAALQALEDQGLDVNVEDGQ